MTAHNPKVNEFVSVVEAINDGELTVQEMHDTYTNSDGYIDCDNLERLEYVATRIGEVIELAKRTRESF